jgi:hypothetical protein
MRRETIKESLYYKTLEVDLRTTISHLQEHIKHLQEEIKRIKVQHSDALNIVINHFFRSLEKGKSTEKQLGGKK